MMRISENKKYSISPFLGVEVTLSFIDRYQLPEDVSTQAGVQLDQLAQARKCRFVGLHSDRVRIDDVTVALIQNGRNLANLTVAKHCSSETCDNIWLLQQEAGWLAPIPTGL